MVSVMNYDIFEKKKMYEIFWFVVIKCSKPSFNAMILENTTSTKPTLNETIFTYFLL